MNYKILAELGFGKRDLSLDYAEQVETEAKYQFYIERQRVEVERMQRLEGRRIPDWFDYERIPGLRYEARQKLKKLKPQVLGQATRIDGVTPADVAILIVHLERAR
jgi:tRNA uridine 5-carboxymethylaminomethyl modification enzyme